MKNLIIIPFHDYKKSLEEGFRTRDSHLYENFIGSKKLNKVVIINRPTSLIEILMRRKKLLTLKNNLIYKNENCYIQELKNNVFIIDILVLDTFQVILKRHAWLPYIYARKDVFLKIENALNFLNISNFSIYMSSPFSVKLGDQLKASYKALDAVDNFAKYENWKYFRKEIKMLYQTAKNNYDKIYVNSVDTFNYLNSNIQANLELIPNGVDSVKFKKNYKRPIDLPKGKIIVGYAGKMQQMFNAKLLAKLAAKYPNINFVLLGVFLDKSWKKLNWDKFLKKYPNIFYLGDKKYEDLPSYYQHFDICMIPYYMEKQHGGDPIKFYEYMASDKPIISTDIGNIKKFHNNSDIFICQNEDAFLEKFQFILKNLSKYKISNLIPSNIEWNTISEKMIKDFD